MTEQDSQSARILCVGMGWFPNAPGGLNRYVYEFTHQLSGQDQVQLAAADLPQTQPQESLAFINLSSAQQSLISRLGTTWCNSKNWQTLEHDLECYAGRKSVWVLCVTPTSSYSI